MANVYDYPAVANLRDQAAAMHSILSEILPTSSEDIAVAPWYSESAQDLGYFVRLAAQAIGIDNVVIAAGYPPSAIDAIVNMLNGQDYAIAAGMNTENWTYTANFCYQDGNQADGSQRSERAKIVYAPKPPVRPTGSLANVFRDCSSLMGIDPNIADDEVVGWQAVTSLSYAFNGSTILPTTELSLDIPECLSMLYFGGNFKKIKFVNSRKLNGITEFQYTNVFLNAIENWNVGNVISSTVPLPSLGNVLQDITFDGLTIDNSDGTASWAGGQDYRCDADDANAFNLIRSGQVLGKTATVACQVSLQSALTAETMLLLVYMAYDWGTEDDSHNPLGLSNRPSSAMLTYDFTETQKQTLAGYIAKMGWTIDPQAILAAKGWTY